MGDDKQRLVAEGFANGPLELRIGSKIDTGGGLVEYNDTRVLDECARQGDERPFSDRPARSEMLARRWEFAASEHVQVVAFILDGHVESEATGRCSGRAIGRWTSPGLGRSRILLDEPRALQRVPKSGIVVQTEGVEVGAESAVEQESVL